MSISFSGLGSSLPIDTWIEKLVALKQTSIDKVSSSKTTMTNSSTDLSTLKASYSSLYSSLQKITDSNFGATSNLFAQKTATTSNSSSVTATATALASTQDIKVSVSQLATATTAESVDSVASIMSGTTKLSSLASGQLTEGSFSIYADNKKYNIAVASTDTIDTVLGKINSLGVAGLSATVTDGKMNIENTTPGSSLVIGANSDTTNFTNIVALVQDVDGSYASSKTILASNTSAALTGTSAGFKSAITTGSFTIGTETFTVDATKSLNNIISEINNNTKAGATAYWDSGNGKLVLTSTKEGATNIDIKNVAGNFTDVMGLTNSTYDNGVVTASLIADGSQELGKYAKLNVNGTDFVSSSNTVTSDITGLTGVTLSLTAESTVAAPSTTISVANDNSSLTSAIGSFISNFNTVISQTDTATSSTGSLFGELSLTSIRNGLRQTATASISDSTTVKYNSLADVGISTGAVGTDLSANTNQLVVDYKKLAAAMADDPEAVKKLFIGDGTTQGVLTKLSTLTNASLDPVNGYFAARAVTFTNQLKDLTETISAQTDALATYKSDLTTKFNLMDAMIANMRSQYDKISGILNPTTSSSSSSS